MIGKRAALKSFTCIECQSRILNAFVSTNGLSFRHITSTHAAQQTPAFRPFAGQIRQLSSLHSEDSTYRGAQHEAFTENEDENEDSSELQIENDSDEPPQEDATPWYLQVDPPNEETTSSLLQRQRLPELPLDPPPLLQPMLEHIFLELGIDDLMLFDLRKLDPPPALGANLIMIIGTARSEKHLHVSADRFNRYMKTTHRVSPYADGLLGRGELKLKLKRKARRARILSRVGTTEPSKADDGIRTGWICVTVTNIENGKSAPEAPKLPDDYVGFGGVENGANVVIQMMTQEKREELDLEHLWGGILKRNKLREQEISQGIEYSNPESEVGPIQPHEAGQTTDFLPMSCSSSMRPRQVLLEFRPPQNAALHGVRAFSTWPRKYRPAAAIFEFDSAAPSYRPEAEESREDNIADEFLAALPSKYEQQKQQSGETDADTLRLNAHLDFARSLSPPHARAILGDASSSATPTPFIQSFHAALPLFPTTSQWVTRLDLTILGITISAPNYTKTALIDLFHALQSAHTTIPAELYTTTLTTLLSPDPPLTPPTLHATVEILDDMLFRGHPLPPYDPSHTDPLSLLSLALIHTQHQHPPPLSINIYPRPLSTNIYPKSLSSFSLSLSHPPPLSLEIAKLHACTPHADFDTMWSIWRSFPATQRSRPPVLYAAMLQAVAGTGHRGKCGEVVREVVEVMGREEPVVEFKGEVAEGVRACLGVVMEVEGREGERRGGRGGEEVVGGEWGVLWGWCEKVRMEEGSWAREMDDD